ncbi:HD domain-containing protein [Alloscardovia venturai]
MTWNGWELTERTRALEALHDEQWKMLGFGETNDETSDGTSTSSSEGDSENFIKRHCEIVARIALIIAHNSRYQLSLQERELLVEGALAHDIGTYKVLDAVRFSSGKEPIFRRGEYIKHGIYGYSLLLSKGFDGSIAQFARNHTGVGLTKEDCVRQNLPLIPTNYVPQNSLQEIVLLADKFHTKSLPPQFVSTGMARHRCEKFGEENIARWDKLVATWSVPTAEQLEALAREYSMGVMKI